MSSDSPAGPVVPPAPDPASMRVSYTAGKLRRADLRQDPFEQFAVWFGEACGASLVEPNAMSLATVGADGRPSVRTVLLKHWDERGFVFFTNLESRKAQEIAANPQVALLFAWLPLQRQLAVQGRAERIPTSEVLAYFVKRPYGSQIAAWASPQSRALSARAVLEMKWEEMKRKFREGEVPLPSFWGGYRVVPATVDLWQGRESRLHDRFMYTRQSGGGWTLERWAP